MTKRVQMCRLCNRHGIDCITFLHINDPNSCERFKPIDNLGLLTDLQECWMWMDKAVCKEINDEEEAELEAEMV